MNFIKQRVILLALIMVCFSHVFSAEELRNKDACTSLVVVTADKWQKLESQTLTDIKKKQPQLSLSIQKNNAQEIVQQYIYLGEKFSIQTVTNAYYSQLKASAKSFYPAVQPHLVACSNPHPPQTQRH